MWRCILRKQLEKLLAIVLGSMSVAILLAEATILPSGVDLSLFSILINDVHNQEVLVQVNLSNYSHSFLLATSKLLSYGNIPSIYQNVNFSWQVAAFIPLMYMCVCTYYSVFKIGMLTFYSLTPRQTSSVKLLMICGYVFKFKYIKNWALLSLSISHQI